MRKISLTATLIAAFIGNAFGQSFKLRYSESVQDTLTAGFAEWVALDRDTLLDVLIAGHNPSGMFSIHSYRNDSAVLVHQTITSMKLSDVYVKVYDWDKDQFPDLVVKAHTEAKVDTFFVLLSDGHFNWEQHRVNINTRKEKFHIIDLNHDEYAEIICYGKDGWELWVQEQAGWRKKVQSTAGEIDDVVSFPFSATGSTGWVTSGTSRSGSPFMTWYWLSDKGEFDSLAISRAVAGKLAVAEVNGDNHFDLFAAGAGLEGPRINVWHLSDNSSELAQSEEGVYPVSVLAANINSDSTVEYVVSGIDQNGKPTSFWLDSALKKHTLFLRNTVGDAWGDADRDGDLDWLVVADSAGKTWIRWFDNGIELEDQRPTSPEIAFSLTAFDRTFLFWLPAADDLTETSAITYDVWLGNHERTLISPNFSLEHLRRTRTAYGNAGNRNIFEIRELLDDRYFYQIQSVDNAFNGSYGVCKGGVQPCFDLTTQHVQVCDGDSVTLDIGETSHWVSLADGYLFTGSSYTYVPTKSDTLISVAPQSTDCAKHIVWLINVNEGDIQDSEQIFACVNSEVQLGIARGWPVVEWQTLGMQKNVDSILYKVVQNETIIVHAQSGGCTYEKEFVLRLSTPMLLVNEDQYVIARGQSTSLSVQASPGTLTWSPETGLENTTSALVTAAPLFTTEYVVTLSDSIGCTTAAGITVTVQGTAYIPNLFSPNADGKNDRLKIYGLENDAAEFRFSIYNREGISVFEAARLEEATLSGWDGTTNGQQQPAGVYFWKVSGRYNDGRPLLLNGENKGSILLIH